ncbi:hypothetical protein B0H14DRAFT_2565631 [Mycena olivaceomarginata]|nr:hypothetical protein B0H14DRAFT_2565631 [Mycena olivaceomarginata]
MICVFKLLAAWPAAELLPSYGIALAPHVLISVAEIKTRGSSATGLIVFVQKRPETLEQSPSGCSLPGPTSTPFDDCRGNPVRLRAEACATVGFLLLFSATHSHSVTSSILVSVAGGIDESLFKQRWRPSLRSAHGSGGHNTVLALAKRIDKRVSITLFSMPNNSVAPSKLRFKHRDPLQTEHNKASTETEGRSNRHDAQHRATQSNIKWIVLVNFNKSLETPPSACSHDFEVPAEIPTRDSMLQGIEKAGMNDCFERKEALETDGILHLLVEKWGAGGQGIDEAVERFQGTRVHEGRDLDATVRGGSKEDAVTRRITRISLFTASSLLLFLALPLSPAPQSSQAVKKRKIDRNVFINPYGCQKIEAPPSSTPPPNRTPLNSRTNNTPANLSILSSSSTTSSLLLPLRTAEFSPVIPLRDEYPFHSTIDPSLDSHSDLNATLQPASSEYLLPAFQVPLVQTAPNVIHPIRRPPRPAQAPLPKAVTDKILQERDTDIHDLDNENRQLWQRINRLEEIHGAKLEHIIDFIENNEFSATGGTHTSASGSGSKGKSERDNVFNPDVSIAHYTAMRKVFKAAMGHGISVKLDILANDNPIKAGVKDNFYDPTGASASTKTVFGISPCPSLLARRPPSSIPP